MIYKFSYYADGIVCYDVYDDDVRALAKFMWLVQKRLPFKVITIKKKHKF